METFFCPFRDGIEHPITYSEAEERARLIAEDVAQMLIVPALPEGATHQHA